MDLKLTNTEAVAVMTALQHCKIFLHYISVNSAFSFMLHFNIFLIIEQLVKLPGPHYMDSLMISI